MIYTVGEIKEKIKLIATKYDVREMYLFGSYARGEAVESSDLDFAVQIKNTKLIGMEFFDFHIELEEMFNKDVDLITLDGVYKSRTKFENYFASEFDKDKIIILKRK